MLKPGGQVVYGVPVERHLMVFFFHQLGYNIHEHHFSTEKDVFKSAGKNLSIKRIVNMPEPFGMFGGIYQVVKI